MANIKPRVFGSNNGFSLLELLIYVAIIAIVTLFIAGIFLILNKSRGQIEARNEVNSNLRFAIEKISQDIKAASNVSAPASAGATSTSLQIAVSGSNVIYCVADAKLRRQVNGSCDASSEKITDNSVKIESLIFTRLENTNAVLNKTVVSIGISLSAAYNSTSTDWQYSASKKTTISLR